MNRNTATLMRDLVTEVLDLVNSERTFTDIHIEQDAPVRIKTPREWQTLGEPVLFEEMQELLNSIDYEWENRLRNGAIDHPVVLTKARLRCNVYRTCGGKKVVVAIRRLPLLPLPLDKTGLPLYIKSMCEAAKGLVLVTGSTGAGKTTSTASMLDYLNATRSAHIVTIEQPIEYMMTERKSLVSQKEVGSDVVSFSAGLREALRQRPDVIMVGEVRDAETAETVLHAAESGHLVFATLHTSSAIGAINKLLSFFPMEQRLQRSQALADALVGVVCQCLVPTERGESFALASELMFNNNRQVSQFIAAPEKAHLLGEFMRRKDDNMSRTLNDDLARLVAAGTVAARDALRASYDRAELQDMIARPR
ncbi:Flp pilus assembly complex ATPase component TadA [Aquincola sp. S2]|uniref:Flp pilus assembly complex ATPase component TadA n=1 Tax=Pseudaquabacterium terrae TaxID=2732868 RepID=A0ABX2EIH8_9BURK|nr:ATPase, T2SS/T4P/T4SS family [Aquabacterium terrae]NRF68442.1 Flp pilus assembly complex ATPase component TadA [Aquabacterium terrae]